MAERRPPTEPFWQFCAALNRFGVDYVVIGSEAVAFHGVPRFSVDFDHEQEGQRPAEGSCRCRPADVG